MEGGKMKPNLPNMSNVVRAWMQSMILHISSKSIVNFEVVEDTYKVWAVGTRQPMTAQKLAIKPEGQRSWLWQELHLLPDVKLNVDDQVRFDPTGPMFRVMAKEDFSDYGYIRYELTQGFEA
jgi:hypothetical protein